MSEFTQRQAERIAGAQFASNSKSFRRLNPHLFPDAPEPAKGKPSCEVFMSEKSKSKPVLNKLEADCRNWLVAQGEKVMEQAITLRLDPPFKSYRADLAYVANGGSLVLVECKGNHRFRRAGIAKLALAAKMYPMFLFVLMERDGRGFKLTLMGKNMRKTQAGEA